jgi:serine/threonine-protein kinase
MKRQVALKFPYAGPFQRQLAERLARERDILASLEHPNIARLYDADVAASGAPFLVLEYVDGIPISEYCDRHQLTIRERLKLFLQVLNAVQYAHARLVIHRDIKPSNILITHDGVAHLLDFGVAKLMPEGLAKETALTNLTGRALTPDYASPEQITGGVITTTSDVYSLGVVLYELLVGARPYRLKRDSRASLEDAIAEADAVVPSRAVKPESSDAQAKSSAAKRAAQLRGDLDAILLKALHRETGRRYATADTFRGDIERHLAGQIVLVRSASAGYRLRKFLRRNRLAVAAAAAVVVALALGLGIALWQAQRARQQAFAARAVEQFMQDIFRANSSSQTDPAQARQTTARQLLDIGAKNLRSTLDATPEAKLEVLSTLADMYHDLRLEDKAVELQRERVQVAISVFGNRDAKAVDALLDLADEMQASSSVSERASVLARAKEVLDRSGDRTSLLRARLLENTAVDLESTDRARALRLGDQAVAIYRKYPPSADLSYALSIAARGHVFFREHAIAVRDLEEAIAISQKLGSQNKSQLVTYYAYAAESYVELSRYPDAERSFATALKIAGDIDAGLGVDSAQVATRFGIFLCGVSQFARGLQLLSQAADSIVRVRGANDSFHTPTILAAYGRQLFRHGAPEQSLNYLEQAVANRRKNLPNTFPLTQMLENQAMTLTQLGATDAAKAALDEAAAIHVHNHDSPVLQFNYQLALIDWLIAADQSAEALQVASALTYEPLEGAKLSANWLDAKLAEARALLATNQANLALAVAAQINERIAASALRPYLKYAEARATMTQGTAELMLHEPNVAEPLLAHAVELIAELNEPQSPWLAQALIALAEAKRALGERQAAAELVTRATAIEAAHPKLGKQYRQPLRELQAHIDR